MNYQEAKTESIKFNIDEWEFGNLDAFIFAVEFAKEKELEELKRISFKKSIMGHTFGYDYQCHKCGLSKDVSMFQKIYCHEVLVLKNRGLKLEEIEGFIK